MTKKKKIHTHVRTHAELLKENKANVPVKKDENSSCREGRKENGSLVHYPFFFFGLASCLGTHHIQNILHRYPRLCHLIHRLLRVLQFLASSVGGALEEAHVGVLENGGEDVGKTHEGEVVEGRLVTLFGHGWTTDDTELEDGKDGSDTCMMLEERQVGEARRGHGDNIFIRKCMRVLKRLMREYVKEGQRKYVCKEESETDRGRKKESEGDETTDSRR